MLKLAIAAGLTLTFLCGFMTLQNSVSSLFGGSGSRDTSLLSGLKGALGSSGSNILDTNSDLGGNSGYSGGGYLPPKSASDANEQDLTTPLFRIFILSTSSTTPPPSTNSTPETLEEVKTESSSSSITTSPAPPEAPKPSEEVSFTPAGVPTPMIPPALMLSLNGQGEGRHTTLKIPITTLHPPSESSTTDNPDNENGLNDDMLDTNIHRPGYNLQPPNDLYLPPKH